jgi:hypothetical protein
MRVVAWCSAVPETLVLLKEKESEPTLALLDQERVLFHALVGKRVPSLLPEAKQSIARREAEVTVQHVTSHCISRCILLPCSAPGWIG